MPVFSPSDVRSLSPAGPIRVGGRIDAVRGRTIELTDAFDRVTVELSSAPSCSPRDLALVEGELAEGQLVRARILETWPWTAIEHRETARLARVARALRARSEMMGTIRRFFEMRDFVEVETPALVPSPGLDLHLDAFRVDDVHGPRFDGHGYLSTSPEMQMKRLLAGGLPRIFQLARCFRRGELGSRHNPEFTMLEWYRAFAGFEDVMADTEALVKEVLGPSITIGDVRVDLEGAFERWTVGEAFERFAETSRDAAIELATTDEERFFRLLVDAVEPGLARLERPVFLTHFPAPFASLAQLSPENPAVCERFELYAGGVELCNGFGELRDPKEQRERFERDQRKRTEEGKEVYPVDARFLSALEEGMPPSAGNALGVDRLVALALDAPSIQDVQTFPFEWL